MILQVLFIFAVLAHNKASAHPQLGGRIVGGSPVDISLRPYQISLQYFLSHICGGSILNEKNGITAAHCVIGKAVPGLSVYTGSNSHRSGGIRRDIKRVIIHKNYDDNTSDYDIAILHFSFPLGLNYKVMPIALPRQNEPIPRGSEGIVSGWGYTKEDVETLSLVLLEVKIKMFSRVRCNLLYINKGVVTPRMICAGKRGGGGDACQGDSGGPLVVNGKLVGIVSWGYGCARPGYPGVYTKVANFINWINNTLC